MAEDRPLRVLLLEDHLVVGPVVAAEHAELGFEPLGVLGSVESVTARMAEGALPPVEVVVADIDLGDAGMALDLPARLGPGGPAVVFLTGHEEPAVIRAAVLGGASASCTRRRRPPGSPQPSLTAAGQTSFRRADVAAARSGPAVPSPRELEVLRGVVGGLASKEITAAWASRSGPWSPTSGG